MTTIVTRAGKGSPLTNAEVDQNFLNLNADKLEASALSPYLLSATAASTYQTIAGMSSYLTTASAASTYLTQSSAASSYQPLDGDLTSIAGLAGTSGILKKTAANTWALDTSTYLTGNQTITISGDASGSGATAISLTLANSGVTAGTYGSATNIPQLAVDAKGRITSVTNVAVSIPSGSLTFTGDVTGSGSTGSTTTLTLAASGVTAGTYTKVTVDAKGRVTTGASLASADLPTYTGTLTSSQVTTALGYTPYNSSNPNGYITSSGSISGNAATASNASLLNNISAVNLYNNMGDAHGTRTSFDAAGAALSVGFGYRYVQGNTNAPNVGNTGNNQYYSWVIGLGSDYAASSYAAQFAIPRNGTTPYLSVRFEEGGVLGAWQKLSAGYADSAGSASNATTVGGFTPSQSSGAASRVVVADGNGYIFNNYFNSTDNSVASGVTAVMVKAGDNYYRSGTAAAIAAFISGQTMNIGGTAANASSISSAVGGNYTWTGTQNFQSANNTSLNGQAGTLVAYSTGSTGATMSFHRPGIYAINMGLDNDNVFRIGGWSAAANRWQLDMSGNGTFAGTVKSSSGGFIFPDGTVQATAASGGGGGSFSAKTSNYTAAASDKILADTSGGSFTITLPASPSTGDTIDIADSKGTFYTNPLTVARNGKTIMGLAEDMVVSMAGASVTLCYNGSDWRII